MALQPGDRKGLPRMPKVLVKEKLAVRIAKSPFRVTGKFVRTTGTVIKQVGHGLAFVADKISMGSAERWVLEEDLKEEQAKKEKKEVEEASKKTKKNKDKKVKSRQGRTVGAATTTAAAAKVVDCEKDASDKLSVHSDGSSTLWDEKKEVKEFC